MEKLEDGYWWVLDKQLGRRLVVNVSDGWACYAGSLYLDPTDELEWRQRFEVLERVKEPQ